VLVDSVEALFAEWERDLGEVRDVSDDMMRLTLWGVGGALFNSDFRAEAGRIGHALELCLKQGTLQMMSMGLLRPWMPTPGNRAAKAAQVQSRVKALEKIERVEPPKTRKVVRFDFRRPPRSGEEVATLDAVSKAYGRRVVHDGLSMVIRRGERWCVMGKNGAGKTTLLRMVAGALAPDSGQVKLGASLKLGYFAQQALDLLDPTLTVFEQLQQDFPQDGIGALRSLAGAFQFSGDDVDKRIRSLSGGEKSRLVMARMLFDPPNFLVLDEPTNHLDLATKEMLVEALRDFEGTMLFVSHDRTFLRGLSNRVLELGGESGTETQPHLYPGSYVEYVARTGHEAPGVHA
jgi:ATPase subunit of ABC transporter with duplicated ATPase domains